MDNLQELKDEYQAALFKAATKAANTVAGVLESNNTSFNPLELQKVGTALKLLAIVQGVPLSNEPSPK